VLSGATGLISDPFFIFNATPPDGTDTAKFSGAATPDPDNVGRYTIKLGITATGESAVNFVSVIYQASGGQLFLLDEDKNGESVFLGMFQQQGSLAGLPSGRAVRAKSKLKRKR
jgi:hypothetical protein